MKGIACWLLLAAPAAAADLSQRIEEGDLALATEPGQEYLELIAPHLRQATRLCLQDAPAPPFGEGFTLVGTVTPDGSLASVEVLPASALGACLRRQLQTTTLPPPPPAWGQRDFPLTVRQGFQP